MLRHFLRHIMRLLALMSFLFGALPVSSSLQAAEFLNPQVAFQPQATRLDANTLEVRFTIAKGYYLYKDRFKFAAAGVSFRAPILPAGKIKKDENFGDVEVYFKEAVIRLPVLPGSGVSLENLQVLEVTSMGCADGGIQVLRESIAVFDIATIGVRLPDELPGFNAGTSQ